MPTNSEDVKGRGPPLASIHPIADRDSLKSLELPSRRPYELLKRDAEGLFLQGCAAKTHAPDATERLFRHSL